MRHIIREVKVIHTENTYYIHNYCKCQRHNFKSANVRKHMFFFSYRYILKLMLFRYRDNTAYTVSIALEHSDTLTESIVITQYMIKEGMQLEMIVDNLNYLLKRILKFSNRKMIYKLANVNYMTIPPIEGEKWLQTHIIFVITLNISTIVLNYRNCGSKITK